MGDVDAVAGAGGFYFVAAGAGGVPAFEVGIDGAVGAGDEHPAGLGAPGGDGNGCGKIVAEVEDLGAGHEDGLLGGKVGGEIFVELRGIDVGEAVGSFLDGAGFGEIAGEALAVGGFGFAGVWHVRGDVDESDHRRVDAGFSDYGAAIAVGDEDGGSVLEVQDALGRGDVIFEGGFGFLDHGDVVAVFGEDVVDGAPAGGVGPSAVNQNDIFNAGRFLLRR